MEVMLNEPATLMLYGTQIAAASGVIRPLVLAGPLVP
jgi:hypothetical protein